MISEHEVYGRAQELRYSSRTEPEVLRCGRLIAAEIERINWQRMPPTFLDHRSTFAMLRVEPDEWMEPAAWQITDAAGTLLYDCRMSGRSTG